MISPETAQRLAVLRGQQNEYLPNAARSEQLTALEALLFVAPSAGGKTFIMQTVAHLSPRHAIAGTNTSRAPRPDDGDRYGYFTQTDDGLAPFFRDVAAGEVIQYVIHPSNDVYCTYISDYSGEINMLDTQAQGVEAIRRLPFRRVNVVSLVTAPEEWLPRFNERFPAEHEKRASRVAEAITSLTWSLDQSPTDTFWIENIAGEPATTARHIIDLAHGRYMYEPHLRLVAERCLAAAVQMEKDL